MKKGNRKKILNLIDPETHEISWNAEGTPYKFKEKKKIEKGKISRARGARFELKVRKDLEEKGKVVDKWSNNVDLEDGKIFPAKRKYNPFSRVMTIGTGFPDFVAFSEIRNGIYSVIGVEVKLNVTISKEEKEKCRWYLERRIFSEIWIAKQKKVGRKIDVEYENFIERYPNKT